MCKDKYAIGGGKPHKYQLYCGDCIEQMQLLPSSSIDMILIDPPYGQTRNEWDKKLPLDKLFEQMQRVLKERGVIAMFAKQRFTIEAAASNIKLFRYKLIWRKTFGTDFLNCNRKPLSCHEDILIFYRKQPVYNPQITTGHDTYSAKRGAIPSTNYGRIKDNEARQCNMDGSRYPTDILTFPIVRKYKHSTVKPVPLLEWLIKTYTNEGATVLDPCMGSGSTGVASMNTTRNFIGIERHEPFFSTAAERIASSTR